MNTFRIPRISLRSGAKLPAMLPGSDPRLTSPVVTFAAGDSSDPDIQREHLGHVGRAPGRSSSEQILPQNIALFATIRLPIYVVYVGIHLGYSHNSTQLFSFEIWI